MSNKKLDEILNIFLNKKKLDGVNDQTLSYYKNHLSTIFKYMIVHGVKTLNDMTDNIIIDFLQSKRINAVYYNINLRVLKYLYTVLDIPVPYILSKAKKMRVQSGCKDVFTLNEMKKMFAYVDVLSNNYNNLTYKCIILLLAETACRRTELINIKTTDVDLDTNTIWLSHTKNADERIVHFSDKTKKLLRIMMKYSKEYLLMNILKKRKITCDDVRYTLKKTGKNLNIKIITAHMFRRTFATLANDNGVSTFDIQFYLGHKNPTTTLRYTKKSNKASKRAINGYLDNFIH